MSSPAPPSDVSSRDSYIDWHELSGLDRVAAIYGLGTNAVVVETCEGREVRITAWFDHGKGEYLADFERRTAVKVGEQQLRVWAHTPAYPRCVAGDIVGCLEAAILAVDRMPVY